MKQCPNCGNYMEWYMEYRCGVPYSDWRCKRCGYDTARLQTYATANIQTDHEMISTHLIYNAPTIEPKLCASCPYNPVEAMIRNGGEDVCPDAFKPVAKYCKRNCRGREADE